MSDSYHPVYLAGPTGVGKTAVAMELSSRLDRVEIINADAFQLYRGLEIISAAPSSEERERIPHHLFGILEPTEICDAAQFADRARKMIEEVRSRAVPLVVGGSGLYLKAITHGLAPTPKSDPALRAKLDLETLEDLVSRYRELDPEGAKSTNLKNRRYVTRNLEISLLTGEPASSIKNAWQENAPNLCAFFLKRQREDLYDRINRRTLEMFADGVIEEIKPLPELSPTAEKAIGIREIRSLLKGEMDEPACIAAIQQASRRYAKRQESWFRREPAFQPVEVTESTTPQVIASQILQELQEFP